jgi:hypothetical protein
MDSEIQTKTLSTQSNIGGAAIDLSFAHDWQAEILKARPAILPARHFVYPREAEEVERGALEVLVKPLKPEGTAQAGVFLATCALGFADPAVPTGIWAAPNAREMCAVAGGYAYVIDTVAPERFTMIEYRPVLEVRALAAEGLLLFVGHRSILAWGRDGQAWETKKLSDEGVRVIGAENGVLRGVGWEMWTDTEKVFAVDLRDGRVLG